MSLSATRSTRVAGLDPLEARSPRMVWFFAGVMARAIRRDFHALRLAAISPSFRPAGPR